MKARTAFLLTGIGFLLGIVLGFLFSPVKHGINVEVCNNGSTLPADEIAPKKSKAEEKEKPCAAAQ